MMSQTFSLQLATATVSKAAQQLGVTSEQLKNIRVGVSAAIEQQPEPYLWLTYHIQLPYQRLAAQLNWPRWTPAQVEFTDYLWEQTCLECFIGGNSTDANEVTGYIEINASPSGRYALYQFDRYRHPNTLPPKPLRLTDADSDVRNTNNNKRAHIEWANALSNQANAPTRPITTGALSPTCHPTTIYQTLSTLTFSPPYGYQCCFGLPLSQLPPHLFGNTFSDNAGIKQLHPCVILWFGDVDLYFAPVHASPPDFHQQRYWRRCNA